MVLTKQLGVLDDFRASFRGAQLCHTTFEGAFSAELQFHGEGNLTTRCMTDAYKAWTIGGGTRMMVIETYSGTFVDGKQTGRAKVDKKHAPDQEWQYEGGLLDSVYHGPGVLTSYIERPWPGAMVIRHMIGTFKHGKLDGRFLFTYDCIDPQTGLKRELYNNVAFYKTGGFLVRFERNDLTSQEMMAAELYDEIAKVFPRPEKGSVTIEIPIQYM